MCSQCLVRHAEASCDGAGLVVCCSASYLQDQRSLVVGFIRALWPHNVRPFAARYNVEATQYTQRLLVRKQ